MILVTGASGFVGQHLVRFLSERGESVRALYLSHPPAGDLQALPGVSWERCDLLDIFEVEDVMKDITEVYHCAAVVSFNPSEKKKMMHFNVEGTVNIVNEAVLRGVRKLVCVSSVAALGRTAAETEITEEEQWEESKYNSRYGLSKHLAEMEVWRGEGEGLNVAVVNPGIILGEGRWDEGSARLMKVVYKEFPFYTAGINGWVDVKDVVRAMVELMGSDITGERFILSAGNFSYREVFTMMAEKLGKRPPYIKASGFMTALVWRWSMLRSKLFGETATITKETARSAQKRSFYDNGKLMRFLPGFSYTPLETTISRIAKAFMADHGK